MFVWVSVCPLFRIIDTNYRIQHATESRENILSSKNEGLSQLSCSHDNNTFQNDVKNFFFVSWINKRFF
jgi:hypothetical protein